MQVIRGMRPTASNSRAIGYQLSFSVFPTEIPLFATLNYDPSATLAAYPERNVSGLIASGLPSSYQHATLYPHHI